MAAPPHDVIDWHEAMQQTGDDEEFLRELLADLRQETDTQVTNIEQIIQVSFCYTLLSRT
jgi:HPt (histidine-containing phosphotransfer) domain-containing protein